MVANILRRFNIVILPVNSLAGDARRYQISANCPGYLRMVSPDWSEHQVRSALAGAGITMPQADELFRGNRMVFGGRDPRYIFYGEEQLGDMGLTPIEDAAPVKASVAS